MPEKLLLKPDDQHLPDVGKSKHGSLYWIDVQLASEGNDTRDFVATYLFDYDGVLIHFKVDDVGLRSKQTEGAVKSACASARSFVGVETIESILVRPFKLEFEGRTFGLSVRRLVDKENAEVDFEEVVDVLPGWTLMFYPPWDECCFEH